MRSKSIKLTIVALGYTAQQASWIAGETEPTDLPDMLWLYKILANGSDAERIQHIETVISNRCHTFEEWKVVMDKLYPALPLYGVAKLSLAQLADTTEQKIEHGTPSAKKAAIRQLAKEAKLFSQLVDVCRMIGSSRNNPSYRAVCKKLETAKVGFDELLRAILDGGIGGPAQRICVNRLLPQVEFETVKDWSTLREVLKRIESEWPEAIAKVGELAERMYGNEPDEEKRREQLFGFWRYHVCQIYICPGLFRFGFQQMLPLAKGIHEAVQVCVMLGEGSHDSVTAEMWAEAEQLMMEVPATFSEVREILCDDTAATRGKGGVTAKGACINRLPQYPMAYGDWVALHTATDGKMRGNTYAMEGAIANGLFATAETADHVVESLESTIPNYEAVVEASLRVCRDEEDWIKIFRAAESSNMLQSKIVAALLLWNESVVTA